jgi:hypothetical protein
MKPLDRHREGVLRHDQAARAGAPTPKTCAAWRLELDGKPVAVVMQRLIESERGQEVGWHPLARIITDEDAAELSDSNRRPLPYR